MKDSVRHQIYLTLNDPCRSGTGNRTLLKICLLTRHDLVQDRWDKKRVSKTSRTSSKRRGEEGGGGRGKGRGEREEEEKKKVLVTLLHYLVEGTGHTFRLEELKS